MYERTNARSTHGRIIIQLPSGSSGLIQQSFVSRLVQWLGCLESHEMLTSETCDFLTPTNEIRWDANTSVVQLRFNELGFVEPRISPVKTYLQNVSKSVENWTTCVTFLKKKTYMYCTVTVKLIEMHAVSLYTVPSWLSVSFSVSAFSAKKKYSQTSRKRTSSRPEKVSA